MALRKPQPLLRKSHLQSSPPSVLRSLPFSPSPLLPCCRYYRLRAPSIVTASRSLRRAGPGHMYHTPHGGEFAMNRRLVTLVTAALIAASVTVAAAQPPPGQGGGRRQGFGGGFGGRGG